MRAKFEKIFEFILTYIFSISQQPVLFRDLLQANALFNEGIFIDPGKLNFKLNLRKSYFIYALICLCVLIPIFGISHFFLVNVDFHFSVLSTIVATSCVFIGFDVFKRKTRQAITKKLILAAWENHFAYFPYEKYSKKVEELYKQSQKNKIASHSLEAFILNGLAKNIN